MDGTLYEKSSELKADIASRAKAHKYLKSKGILQRMAKGEIREIDKKMERGSVSMSLRAISRKYRIDLKDFEGYVYNLNPREFGIRRDPILIKLLSVISKRYVLAVFSNGHDTWVEKTLKVLGVRKMIKSSMIVSPMHLKGYLKPEVGAFRILLKRTCLKPNEILLLDDNPKNIKRGSEMGMATALVVNKGRNKRNSIHSILRRIKYDFESKNTV